MTEEHVPLFFSLMDKLNDLFTSDKPEKILEFYGKFKNSEQIIQWMKERPRGASYIHEIEGDKEIIVVIPTADFHGHFAKECRENIFNGLHIIFVESGNNPDPYFNYAKNCNIGIEKAKGYKPRWIILSNDDVYKIDDISVLIKELRNARETDAEVVFINKSNYHSRDMYIAKATKLYSLYLLIRYRGMGKKINKLRNNFRLKYATVGKRGIFSLTFRKKIPFINMVDFCIFSSTLTQENQNGFFDEIYINHREDSDLSLYIKIKKIKTMRINFNLGDYIGG
ncbi:MAG: hypothetical protein ACYDDC_08895, partial [Thermoplasmataceae archaeon]